MNSKATYWIVGVVIVVIIILVWMFAGKSSSAPVSSSLGATHQETAATARQNLRNLISSGTTETCTFSIAPSATSSSSTGTIYVSSGDMRGDFVTTDSTGKVTNAHMIINGGVDYLWTDALSRGIKLSWSAAASSTALTNRAGAINMDQEATYSCNGWTPDQSKFTLPTNIQFMDISAMMKAYGGSMPVPSAR